jgi:hypothetical protein
VTGRSVALFIHLLGVVTLFIAMGILQRGGAGVRSSSTVQEMRLWLGLVQMTRQMFPTAFVIILGSGLYMANEYWSFDTPWIVVAIISIVVMAVVGGTVVGRGLAEIGRALTSEGPVSPELAHLAGRPAPWVAASALNGIAIGVIWLMVNKPGWIQSTGVVIILAVVAAIIGAAVIRRGSRVVASASGSDN